MLVPLVFGAVGVAILINLGQWQVRRLAWKTALLADIETRIAADPVALPATFDPVADRYLPVTVTGTFDGQLLTVLSGQKNVSAGVDVIAVFVTDDGRRVLVDRGFVPEGSAVPRSTASTTVVGNLLWPNDRDAFTPLPDAKTGLWFARDVPAMALALQTEPMLVVAAAPTGDGIDPMPVSISGIPNDHLGYAITWFSLALVWAGMTGYWLWRIKMKTV